MSHGQLRILADARKRSRKVRRAAAFAALSGWSMLFFAIVSALIAAFGDLTSGLTAAALGVIAVNELRGGRRLARFDESGARLLGFNQVALGILIILYSAWSIYSVLRKPGMQGMLSQETSSQLSGFVSGDDAPLARTLYTAVYTTVAFGGAFATGLTAWYYFSRATVVRRFKSETPPWAIEALRTTLAS
jgi:hypothetical protein